MSNSKQNNDAWFVLPPKGKYDDLPTTSAKIRAMHQDGMSKGAIAKALNKRFQHVRNVLVTPVKNPKL